MGSLKDDFYQRAPVWVQNILVSAYGYHLYRKRYGGMFNDILRLVKQSRSWSREQIEAWQAEQLHNIVRHCRKSVPFYQQLFAEYGLHENDITQPEDVAKLPILDKKTLRQFSSRFRSSTARPYMLQHTSGSTGSPLALDVDEHTYKLAMALLVDHEEARGVLFGTRRATFAGRMIQPARKLSPPFARFNRAENQMLFSSYHLNKETFPWYADRLRNFRPRELIGYPSAISDLASYYLASSTTPDFEPQAVVTNSETLLDWQRERIEIAFNCPVYDYYGTAEYVIFAGQERDKSYRLNPILGVTELLNEQGEPTREGRLVATTLTNKAMPLLRYDIGDFAVNASDETHSRVVYKLQRINGRVDDYVETPDGRRLGRLDHIFKGINGLVEAQIIQTSIEHCTIKAVFDTPHYTDQSKELIRNFHLRTASQIKVDIEIVDQIPRGANGKFRNIIRKFDSEAST